MRVPVLPHHSIVFGRVLHAIHSYLRRRMKDRSGDIETINSKNTGRTGSTRGFLSREHESCARRRGRGPCGCSPSARGVGAKRPSSNGLSAGRSAACASPAGSTASTSKRPERSSSISRRPGILAERGRSRRCRQPADGRLRPVLLEDGGPAALETRLHFLESDIIGRAAKKGEKELRRAGEKIREAAEGIRRRRVQARPDWHSCSVCRFQDNLPAPAFRLFKKKGSNLPFVTFSGHGDRTRDDPNPDLARK